MAVGKQGAGVSRGAGVETAQRGQGLIAWITELVDSVGKPESVVAASELVRSHLVVLVLLKHPELEKLAAREPKTKEEMFHATGAQEMRERRRETIAQLERQRVLIMETTAAEVGVRAETWPQTDYLIVATAFRSQR